MSETTRERVKSIIAEHGYQPNRRARALAAKRSFLLALAYNNPNAGYVLTLLQGVLESVNARGYEVIIHPVASPTSGTAGEDLLRFAGRSGCDGLILTPPLSESPGVLTELTRASSRTGHASRAWQTR